MLFKYSTWTVKICTGKFCDEEIDECLPGPCKNGGTCHDHINAYTCDCDQTGKERVGFLKVELFSLSLRNVFITD